MANMLWLRLFLYFIVVSSNKFWLWTYPNPNDDTHIQEQLNSAKKQFDRCCDYVSYDSDNAWYYCTGRATGCSLIQFTLEDIRGPTQPHHINGVQWVSAILITNSLKLYPTIVAPIQPHHEIKYVVPADFIQKNPDFSAREQFYKSTMDGWTHTETVSPYIALSYFNAKYAFQEVIIQETRTLGGIQHIIYPNQQQEDRLWVIDRQLMKEMNDKKWMHLYCDNVEKITRREVNDGVWSYDHKMYRQLVKHLFNTLQKPIRRLTQLIVPALKHFVGKLYTTRWVFVEEDPTLIVDPVMQPPQKGYALYKYHLLSNNGVTLYMMGMSHHNNIEGLKQALAYTQPDVIFLEFDHLRLFEWIADTIKDLTNPKTNQEITDFEQYYERMVNYNEFLAVWDQYKSNPETGIVLADLPYIYTVPSELFKIPIPESGSREAYHKDLYAGITMNTRNHFIQQIINRYVLEFEKTLEPQQKNTYKRTYFVVVGAEHTGLKDQGNNAYIHARDKKFGLHQLFTDEYERVGHVFSKQKPNIFSGVYIQFKLYPVISLYEQNNQLEASSFPIQNNPMTAATATSSYRGGSRAIYEGYNLYDGYTDSGYVKSGYVKSGNVKSGYFRYYHGMNELYYDNIIFVLIVLMLCFTTFFMVFCGMVIVYIASKVTCKMDKYWHIDNIDNSDTENPL